MGKGEGGRGRGREGEGGGGGGVLSRQRADGEGEWRPGLPSLRAPDRPRHAESEQRTSALFRLALGRAALGGGMMPVLVL